jgi:hypothetical protein
MRPRADLRPRGAASSAEGSSLAADFWVAAAIWVFSPSAVVVVPAAIGAVTVAAADVDSAGEAVAGQADVLVGATLQAAVAPPSPAQATSRFSFPDPLSARSPKRPT